MTLKPKDTQNKTLHNIQYNTAFVFGLSLSYIIMKYYCFIVISI